MPKTIQTTVYLYAELPTETAKARARSWWLEGQEDAFAFEGIEEDARTVGLKIVSLDTHRSNKGSFEDSAPETAENITAQHGAECGTHKTAKAYLANLESLGDRPSDSHDDAGDSAWEDAREDMDNNFLAALLEDYRVMLDREIEYQQSEEYLAGNMKANEYTFTEDGKRFG
jgi:hypothetical protein